MESRGAGRRSFAILILARCSAAFELPRRVAARTPNLAAELAANRRARSLGLAAGCALVGGALAAGDASPAVFGGSLSRAALECAPLAAAAGGLSAALVASRHAALCWRDAAPLPPPAYALGKTAVARAPAGRGEGLFARARIEAGEFVGEYPGERLREDELLARYSDGLTSYVFGLDGGPLTGPDVYLDADPRYYAERPGEREASSGATHKLNHATGEAANVRRDVLHLPGWPWRRSRVRFFAARAIAAGEELRFDYGEFYDWEARGVTPSD